MALFPVFSCPSRPSPDANRQSNHSPFSDHLPGRCLILTDSISLFSAEEERILIRATVDLLRVLASLKLTEREIALLNTVVLFQPGK